MAGSKEVMGFREGMNIYAESSYCFMKMMAEELNIKVEIAVEASIEKKEYTSDDLPHTENVAKLQIT